jgi:DNA-directed RNA polymerase specialized sigma24 family protein
MPTRARPDSSGKSVGEIARGLLAEKDLEAFYTRTFLPLVRRATWKHRVPRDDARDIVQDAFVLAITRLNGAGNPRAWLIQVVDHLSINYRRKAARRAHLAEKWGYQEPGDVEKEVSWPRVR